MRGFACIALDNPKSEPNVGGAMRAAACYGAQLIVASGGRIRDLHRIPTDVFRTWRHVPMLRTTDVFDAIPYDCVPVAIDLIPGAASLAEYKHPERAFYVFGAEDATLGRRILDRCRDVVYVPTAHCMNLAATVNVVLYDRMVKRGEAFVAPSLKKAEAA